MEQLVRVVERTGLMERIERADQAARVVAMVGRVQCDERTVALAVRVEGIERAEQPARVVAQVVLEVVVLVVVRVELQVVLEVVVLVVVRVELQVVTTIWRMLRRWGNKRDKTSDNACSKRTTRNATKLRRSSVME